MAGLIPEAFIQDLLARTDLVELIRARLPLKKSGRNYTACCPFHQEKTPSFSVAPDKQFYYCFGCGAKGDALRFLMEYEHLPFPQAVDMLASLAGMDVPHEETTPKQKQEHSHNQQLYELLGRAERFFQNQLAAAPERQKAHHYIQQRGLDAASCERFRIGYAPPGFDNVGTGLALDTNGQQLALAAGLLAESEDRKRRYDKFRDRLMFPIRDARGRVIGFGGRLLGDGKPKYLNSPETPVFHKGQELYGLWEWHETRQPDRFLIVVEGYLDVISLSQFGIHNAVATLGTSTSELHVQKLFREVDEVIFCFDGDKAGRSAAWRALEATLGELADNKQARFLFLPEGEDPDTLVRSQGPEAMRAACAKALPLETFLFQQLAQDLDTNQIAGRARLAKLALPYIARIKGDFYRSLMEQALAKRTGLDSQELVQLQPAPQPTVVKPTQPVASPRRPTSTGKSISLAEKLFLLLLHYPQLADDMPLDLPLDDLPLPGIDLLQDALALLKQRPASNAAQALGLFLSLPQSETVERLVQSQVTTPAAAPASREWQGGLLQLQLMQLENLILHKQQDRSTPTAELLTLHAQRQQLQRQRQSISHRDD